MIAGFAALFHNLFEFQILSVEWYIRNMRLHSVFLKFCRIRAIVERF